MSDLQIAWVIEFAFRLAFDLVFVLAIESDLVDIWIDVGVVVFASRLDGRFGFERSQLGWSGCAKVVIIPCFSCGCTNTRGMRSLKARLLV